MWTTTSYVLATLAMMLIFAGLATVRRRELHVPLMYGAFALDMIGLLIVEVVLPLSEGRVDPVSGLLGGDTGEGYAIRIAHASFATLSVVGYVVQIVTGRKLQRGVPGSRVRHQRGAVFFLVTRLGAYATMWMV